MKIVLYSAYMNTDEVVLALLLDLTNFYKRYTFEIVE